MIRQAQIAGTINTKDESDPAVEYDKAAQIFSETHDQYMPSYQALSAMVRWQPRSGVVHHADRGRSAHVFQAAAPIPEDAAKYLRDQPEVQRFVSVEKDLSDANTNIDQTEQLIARLEGVIAADDHSSLYPAVASRRLRIAAIEDELIKIRNDLADQQLRLVDSSAISRRPRPRASSSRSSTPSSAIPSKRMQIACRPRMRT